MPLQPLDPAVLEQSQAELKDKLLSGSPVPLSNVENIRGLLKESEFEYPEGSGKKYRIPLVPYQIGLKIEDIYIRIQDAKKYPGALGMLPVYEKQLREALDIVWSCVIPVNRWDRWRKKFGLLKNRFRNMSDGDTADMIAFFLIRRMMSNVKFRYPANQETIHRPSTLLTSYLNS